MTAGFKFDWYQATMRRDKFAIDPRSLVQLMADDLGGLPEDTRGRNGYEITTHVRSEGGTVLASVSHGGRNMWPNVVGTGSEAIAVADLLRRRWPDEHYVTRADVAWDVRGPRAFQDLRGRLVQAADDHGLKLREIGDPRDGATSGRTVYCGSRSSVTFVRLYEKGLELRGKAATPAEAAAIPDDLVRLEIEVKPPKLPGRAAVARMQPFELWGCARWTKKLAEDVLQVQDLERVALAGRRQSDDERALEHLARQYRMVMTREAQRLGSWDLLGRKFGRMTGRIANGG